MRVAHVENKIGGTISTSGLVEQQANSSLEPVSVWVLIDCTSLTARHRLYNATGPSEKPTAYHQGCSDLVCHC
jgi:hypothetical protein